MSNTHGVADMAKELQATTRDLLPACIVTTSWPTVPVPPSLTLAAFATAGYVRDGVDLVYCAQEAHTLTLTGGDGTYWLGLGQDTYTTVASWNRTAGTHYLWRPSATRPPDVDGLLVISSLTVSGGVITAVAPAAGVTRAEALRAFAGLGTLATQNANAVAITGGSANGLTYLGANQHVASNSTGDNIIGFYSQVNAAGGTNRWGFRSDGTAPHYFGAQVQIGGATLSNTRLSVLYPKNTDYGITIRPSDADAGAGYALLFLSQGGAQIGSINTTGSATSYNTSSDVRLKHNIQPLTDSLALLRRLNPISHLWNADGSYGESFLAHELQRELAYAVTGEPDAVDAHGEILPQQVDNSKIVPRLVSMLQELLAQVETLTARVTALETALGV